MTSGAAMDRPSSSSKVTVEYYDPSSVFSLIASGLQARLPLRHLHWNSQSRPLRSINSLHVDLVPSAESPSTPKSRPDTPSISRPESAGTGSGAEQQRAVAGSVKERRHQIPGLRQTPYLKIYLLRCDDSETYKASSRKLLREWIKTHKPSTQSTTSVNTQENHDAFEWLILHVVVPGTPAAAQARWSSGGGSASGAEKGAGGSRFLGKSSTTIFEKISADFNGTGKTAKDRTAQVRLRLDDLPYSAQIQMPAQEPSSANDDQQDRSDPWEDLISKMKSLILTSFDLRVRQYEEDIREKDSQRNLPGWNFCTFFVLKEGLARGFESAGLVEDALVGYDELAIGLDTIVHDRASEGLGEHQGGTFLDYTEELLREVQAALHTAKDGHASVGKASSVSSTAGAIGAFKQRPERWPLNANKKHYRELILANNISIFDFKCYIFTRQLALLLRLGTGLSGEAGAQERPPSEASQDLIGPTSHVDPESRPLVRKASDAEDLFALAEVCRRAVEFVTSVARLLRSDLYRCVRFIDKEIGDEDNLSHGLREELDSIVESIVSSWEFAVCQQILQETATISLRPLLSSVGKDDPNRPDSAQYSGSSKAGPSSDRGPDRTTHPARTSSLPILSPPVVMDADSEDYTAVDSFSRSEVQDSASFLPPKIMKAGSEELASSRAQLYLLARRILSHLGHKRRWAPDGEEITLLTAVEDKADVEDVSLDEVDRETTQARNSTMPSLSVAGIGNTPLLLALDDKTAFWKLYEHLTLDALSHFTAAARTKSAQKCTADLAVLKFHLGEYSVAASYFHKIAPFYAEDSWDVLEVSMLALYAHCLRQLGRNGDYIRVSLKILAKNASDTMRPGRSEKQETLEPRMFTNFTDPPTISTTDLMADLISCSAELQHQISVPMDRYMRDIKVNPYIRHYDDRDGFQLEVSFHCLLEGKTPVQSMKAKISSTIDGQPREIWLESDGAVTLQPGLVRIWLNSNVITHALYSIDRIILHCQQINLVHDMKRQTNTLRPSSFRDPSASGGSDIGRTVTIFCYSRTSALKAKLSLSKYIHLEQSRSVEIEICSGWNSILEGELRIRAASAGLRLHLAEAVVVDGSMTIQVKTQSGAIAFQGLSTASSAKIRIPYAFESELNEVSLKIEVSYRTGKGQFFYASYPSVSIVLPLGVNVQDSFKEHMLLSKFLVSTVTSVPLRMLKSTLQGSSSFATIPAGSAVAALDILRKQPVSLIYKITRKDGSDSTTTKTGKAQTSLSLSIDYACIDEEILRLVEARFSEAVDESSHKDLSCLLLPVLLDRLRSKLTVTELERATLLQETDLGPFGDMLWQQTLIWLSPARRESVHQWLKKWHEDNRVMSLADIFDSSFAHRPNRRIVIPVAIPSVSVVHTVRLQLLAMNNDRPLDGGLAAVGQIIPATLYIKHTRSWDTARVPEAEEKRLHFSYEVQANPDSWLVAGRRKGHFRAKENEVLRFPLALLPQRAGHLLYPTIEIHALGHGADTSSPVGADDPSNQIPELHCETDYRNQADVSIVLPNLKSSTVSLDPGGPNGGNAWLLDAEQRVEATVS